MSPLPSQVDPGQPVAAAARIAGRGGLSVRGLSAGRKRPNAASLAGESPAELVARLAYQKAADVAGSVREGLVLGCDTVAECEGRILGKPADREDARQMLRTLSGRLHRVLTGLCLWKVPQGRPLVRVATSTLRMDPLSQRQLEEYLAGGQWQGKAGPSAIRTGSAGCT